MFGRLLILFAAIPIIELLLFIRVGGAIGLGTTLGIIVLTAVLGAWLTRRQGLRVLESLRSELAGGRLPHAQVVDGLLVLLAGALLITPGFLTDTIGFLLLAPPVRAALRPRLGRALVGKLVANRPSRGRPRTPSSGTRREPGIIDVEAEIVDDPRKRPGT